MSILIDSATRVIVQGITGGQARFDTEWSLAYGTRIVAGVTPGKGGEAVHGVPVFDTVKAALETHPADMSVIYVPPRFVKDAVLEAIELVASGESGSGIPQDKQLATKAPRLTKADGLVDWSRTAAAIRNQVRALQPWPTTYAFWLRPEGDPLRLIFDQVAAADEEAVKVTLLGRERPPPGTVIAVDKDMLMILCGKGAILPQIVQPAGKRTMTVSEFLRGHPLRPRLLRRLAQRQPPLLLDHLPEPRQGSRLPPAPGHDAVARATVPPRCRSRVAKRTERAERRGRSPAPPCW